MPDDNWILETDRLRLREMTPGDYPDLAAILQDAQVMYAYNGPFSEEETHAWLERQLGYYRSRGYSLWAVTLKNSDRMIGQCGLTLQNANGRQVLELGYHLNRAFWHRGYAAEAARACRDYAFDKLAATEVFAIIRDTNLPSQKVALRCGMQVTDRFIKHYRGVEMPHLVFSVKRKEYL